MANNRFRSNARTAYVHQAESESINEGVLQVGKIAKILKELLEGILSAVTIYLSSKS